MRFVASLIALLAVGCAGSAPPPDMAAPVDQSAIAGDAASGGSCKDEIKNGQETDVDCGGPVCPACAAGKACIAAGDCQSARCDNDVCAAPAGIDSAVSDLAMSMGPDMAAPAGDDMASPPADSSPPPGDMAMAAPPGDMAMANPISCTFDDPNSLFDDCVVAP